MQMSDAITVSVRFTGLPPFTRCDAAQMASSILVVALGQLDIHAGWIGDVCDVEADGGNISKRDVELHAASLELLAEGFQICDLEADVIDRPAFRGDGGRRGRREREVHARSISSRHNRSA